MQIALRRRWRAFLAVALAMTLVAPACGDDDDDSGDTGSGDDKAAAFDFGAEQKATGTPVTIGFISDGKSEAIDNTSEQAAAKAAAEYANHYLNGLGGHPISLTICETKQTANGAADCVNELIAAKVPIVLVNVSGQASTISSRLNEAGIPQFWYASLDQATLTSADAFVMTNGLATAFGGPAKFGQGEGFKTGVEIVTDVPAASGPAKALAVPVYNNAGIAVEVVAIAPESPDMSPQLQPALAENPDMVHITGNDAFCLGAIKALKTLGYTKPVVIIPQCLTPALVAGVPGGLRNVRVMAAESRDPSDKERALYAAVMEEYASGTDVGGSVTPGGYAVVVGLVRATKALTGDVTSESLKAAIRAMASTTQPLAQDLSFKCDGTAVSFLKTICSPGALVAELDAKGNPKSYEAVDASDVMKLG